MTKQLLWTFRQFIFLQFDTKFASKQQRLVKIGTILWLLLSTHISQVWHTTRLDENAQCDMHNLERPLRIPATQCLQCVWPFTAVRAILTIRGKLGNGEHLSLEAYKYKEYNIYVLITMQHKEHIKFYQETHFYWHNFSR